MCSESIADLHSFRKNPSSQKTFQCVIISAMIAQLRGTITHRGINYVIIDISGIGYKVHATANTLRKLRKEKGIVMLWTHLAIRETSQELYGFLLEGELTFFEMLIGISGIGPKSALSILSLADVGTLRSAIMHNDTSYLTRVSGIGKKNAEKIVLELRDKLGALEADETHPSEQADTYEALRSLGYGASEVREVLNAIPSDIIDTGERLKAALKKLGNG